MPLPVSMSFELWKSRGCPVAPFHDLRKVWPTSPYGKSAGEKAPSSVALRDQVLKKKGGKR